MTFDWSICLNYAFWLPLLQSLLGLLAICGGVIGIICYKFPDKVWFLKKHFSKSSTGNGSSRNTTAAISVFVIVFGIVCLLPGLLNLRYGYALPFEKEADLVETAGTVEEIVKLSQAPDFNGREEDGFLREVVIDGERYYFMFTEEIAVGDRLELSYFPKSRFVRSYSLKNSNA